MKEIDVSANRFHTPEFEERHFDDLTDNDKHMSEHLPATKSLSRYLNMLQDILCHSDLFSSRD